MIGRTLKEDGNEEVVAFIERSPDSSLAVADLAAHAQRHLAPYKHPSQFIFVPAMPLTLTGKVVKDELAKMAAELAKTN